VGVLTIGVVYLCYILLTKPDPTHKGRSYTGSHVTKNGSFCWIQPWTRKGTGPETVLLHE
jgi:hypothetical protein